MRTERIDFPRVAQAILQDAERLVPAWLPQGRREGREWSALNPNRADSGLGSFKINLDTGAWSDFATGDKGGDLVSLWAYLQHNGDQAEAARELAIDLRIQAGSPFTVTNRELKRRSHWSAVTPVPEGAPPPPKAHTVRGLPEATWTYRGQQGELLGVVYRFKTSDGGKEILPCVWGRHAVSGKEEWRWLQWSVPRPLYGLWAMLARPALPVLIVEGEKCRDRAHDLLGDDFLVLSWPGGGNAVDRADWSVIRGRAVVIWPDCDAQRDKVTLELLPESKQPGTKAAEAIARRLLELGCTVELVRIPAPGERPDGWDVADMIAADASREDLLAFIANRRPPARDGKAEAAGAAGGERQSVASDPDADEIVSPEFSEDRIALQFVRQHGAGFRVTPGWGWMVHAGTHWEADKRKHRFDLARRVCREVSLGAPERQRPKICKASVVAAVVMLSESDQRIAAAVDAWDAVAHELNTPAGVVDLRDGRMRLRRQDDLLTQVTAVSPDRAVKTSRWDQFLAEVFEGDQEMIAFVQRLMGYVATAERREQVIAFILGDGANGKSVMMDTVKDLLGSYSLKLPVSALMQGRHEQHPTVLAQLQGRRLAISNEVPEGAYWNEGLLKELTGDETLTARYMRQDFFQFRQVQKHVVGGNFPPRLHGGDPAMARRLMLIPFRVRFEGRRRDSKLRDKLRAEYPGILAWIIAGAGEWYRIGLQPPATVRQASAEYLEQHDDLANWVAECCEMSPSFEEPANSLYQAFRIFKEQRGERAPSEKVWSQRMLLMPGISRRRTNGGIRYTGISLTGLAREDVRTWKR